MPVGVERVRAFGQHAGLPAAVTQVVPAAQQPSPQQVFGFGQQWSPQQVASFAQHVSPQQVSPFSQHLSPQHVSPFAQQRPLQHASPFAQHVRPSQQRSPLPQQVEPHGLAFGGHGAQPFLVQRWPGLQQTPLQQEPEPAGQHLPLQQRSPGPQQLTVLPPRHAVSRGPQQYSRSGSAQAAPGSQQIDPQAAWPSGQPMQSLSPSAPQVCPFAQIHAVGLPSEALGPVQHCSVVGA